MKVERSGYGSDRPEVVLRVGEQVDGGRMAYKQGLRLLLTG